MGIYRIISIILILMLPLNTYAQQISYLNKGQTAKFSGVLLDQNLFIEYEINQKNDMTTDECQLKLDYSKELFKTELEYKLRIKDIEIESNKKEFQSRLELKNENIDFLENQIAFNPPSFIERWKYELGFVSGVLLTVAIVAALDGVRFE